MGVAKVACSMSILILLLSVVGYAQEKYVPKDNEELYGTWANEKMQFQKPMNFKGGFKDYVRIEDATPMGVGIENITKKWTDSEGNIWCQTFGVINGIMLRTDPT